MSALGGSGIRIFRGLIALALITASPCCPAGQDLISTPILGIAIGMTPEQVDAVAGTLPMAVSTESKERKGADAGATNSRRSTSVRFADDRFFSIGFASLHGKDQVSNLHLVYQDKSYTKQTIADVLAAYPKPDYHQGDGLVEVFAWGGSKVVEGAVVPDKGVSATLFIEHLKGQHVDISLSRVRPEAD